MTSPPRRRRPRLPLVLFTHPFELALGAVLVINGIRGFLGAPSPSVKDLPPGPLLMYLAVSTLGGLGVVTGLLMHDPSSRQGLGRAVERASLYLTAVSYAGFALLVIANNGGDGVPTGLVGLVIGLAFILRAAAIRRASRVILEELRRARTEGPGA